MRRARREVKQEEQAKRSAWEIDRERVARILDVITHSLGGIYAIEDVLSLRRPVEVAFNDSFTIHLLPRSGGWPDSLVEYQIIRIATGAVELSVRAFGEGSDGPSENLFSGRSALLSAIANIEKLIQIEKRPSLSDRVVRDRARFPNDPPPMPARILRPERQRWEAEVLAALPYISPLDEQADPGNPGFMLKLYRLPMIFDADSEQINVLLMENASTDRDGKRERFLERVPSWITDAVNAAAWQFEVDPSLYRTMERAT